MKQGMQESLALERPLRLSLIGLGIGVVGFLLCPLIIHDEDAIGWPWAFFSLVVLFSGVVSVGARTRWRFLILFLSVVVAAAMAAIAYAFIVQW